MFIKYGLFEVSLFSRLACCDFLPFLAYFQCHMGFSVCVFFFDSLQLKKLVYVYLVRYAEEQQDLALLSISTFQRALKVAYHT